VTEQDQTMFASFALMGILQRVDPANANRAHFCDLAWGWADAMVEAGARRDRARDGQLDEAPALPLTPADAGGGTTATTATATTSDR
jgi:hypothetical protein